MYGKVLEAMKPLEKPLQGLGSPWRPLQGLTRSCKVQDLGRPWNALETFGNPWKPFRALAMETFGSRWRALDPLKALEAPGCPWNHLEAIGGPCTVLEGLGRRRKPWSMPLEIQAIGSAWKRCERLGRPGKPLEAMEGPWKAHDMQASEWSEFLDPSRHEPVRNRTAPRKGPRTRVEINQRSNPTNPLPDQHGHDIV